MNFNILNTIGNTPLIKVDDIYVKLETYNPSGSIKDRMAWYIIEQAEKKGELKKGDEIIEVTSGNTGIALAMISAIRGYIFTAIMPESMSIERQKMMKAFGANFILTPANEDIAGAVRKYNQVVKENLHAWLPKQFDNENNIKAHYLGIAQEIIRQTNGKIDAVVVGVGTGGTLIGIAKALKEIQSEAKIIAVEPAKSAVLSGNNPGLHKIQGIGEGFIPKLVQDNIYYIDEVITIKSQDAINMKNKLASEFGLLVGVSSGANFLASKEAIKRYKKVITIFPDRGERYLS